MSIKHQMTRTTRQNLRNGLLFASPWIIGFLLFTAYPIGASFYYSLCRYSGLSHPQFVGFANYAQLLTDDDIFWKSLWNTLYMVVWGLPISLITSLGLALLLNMKLKGISIYRTIYYLPSIVPVVASSVLWLWLFNPEIGLINSILQMKVPLPGVHAGGVGFSWVPLMANPPAWLGDPVWAKPALIFMGLWGAGGSMIIYLAGLQDVPISLYEAADLDGATAWDKIRFVTIPMLSPVIFFNLIMGLIGSFQYFTQVYVMTQGGPQDATLFYALRLFNRAFLDFKMGYASAMAWILFVITLICTLIVFRTSARWVYYPGETK